MRIGDYVVFVVGFRKGILMKIESMSLGEKGHISHCDKTLIYGVSYLHDGSVIHDTFSSRYIVPCHYEQRQLTTTKRKLRICTYHSHSKKQQ
jgi:hypothetical protein